MSQLGLWYRWYQIPPETDVTWYKHDINAFPSISSMVEMYRRCVPNFIQFPDFRLFSGAIILDLFSCIFLPLFRKEFWYANGLDPRVKHCWCTKDFEKWAKVYSDAHHWFVLWNMTLFFYYFQFFPNHHPNWWTKSWRRCHSQGLFPYMLGVRHPNWRVLISFQRARLNHPPDRISGLRTPMVRWQLSGSIPLVVLFRCDVNVG